MRKKQTAEELAKKHITEEEIALAISLLRKRKIALFLVAYNAEKFLQSVIDRIDERLKSLFKDIYIIDDSSSDTTYLVAKSIQKKHDNIPFHVYQTPYNRGYGGNQKLGYLYAIKKGYDYVILLHGDGQYPPEFLPKIIASMNDDPDAVFASRMIYKKWALEGGMPLYKWIGNQILTNIENKLLATKFSEFHTGYRAFKVTSLKKIPFIFNSNDFHFDTEIIIQAVASNWQINEIPIPAHYGEEVCHVNGFKYALNCIQSILLYKINHWGLYYSRNFDFGIFEDEKYQFKTSPNSLHQYVLNHCPASPEMNSIELGANQGLMSAQIAQKVKHHVAIDIIKPVRAGRSEVYVSNLNGQFSERFHKKTFDFCIALDTIEHLETPENFLLQIFDLLKAGGKLYISTANIAYFLVRLSLVFGQFNYGKRGILDKTHKRLFSVKTFKKLLIQYGFEINLVKGFAPPIVDLINPSSLFRLFEKIHVFLARICPNLFSYNFLIIATRTESIDDILDKTLNKRNT